MQISESVRELIATGPSAHLTTLNPDGSPQVTVVWVGTENDEFVIGHMGVWHKVKNMRRDPRVVLSMLGRGRTPWGCRNTWSSTAKPGSPKEERLICSSAWRTSTLVRMWSFPRRPIATILGTSRVSPQHGSPELVRGIHHRNKRGLSTNGSL
jgi:hypothetical protein